MPAKLVVAPEAELDIAEAYVWYERRRIGLGEEFLEPVDACVGRYRQPEMYSLAHDVYRRALIRRFPYAVFYEFAESTVTVYSVFHTSRDQEKWRRRLPDSAIVRSMNPLLRIKGVMSPITPNADKREASSVTRLGWSHAWRLTLSATVRCQLIVDCTP